MYVYRIQIMQSYYRIVLSSFFRQAFIWPHNCVYIYLVNGICSVYIHIYMWANPIFCIYIYRIMTTEIPITKGYVYIYISTQKVCMFAYLVVSGSIPQAQLKKRPLTVVVCFVISRPIRVVMFRARILGYLTYELHTNVLCMLL